MRALSALGLFVLVTGAPSVAFAAGANGDPCSSDLACDSGHCVDAVCCDDNCGGGTPDCRVCSVALGASTDGTCTALPEGAPCGPGASCTDGLLTPAQTCDGLTVNCEPALVIGCGPYACGATACLTTCTAASDCGLGYRCDGLSCVADIDVSFPDVGRRDSGVHDAGTRDAGMDAAMHDAGNDAAARDATTSPLDASVRDAAMAADASTPAPVPRGCSCAVPSSRRQAHPLAWLALGLLLALRRRRQAP